VYDNQTEPEKFVCLSNDYGLIAIRLQSSIQKCFTGEVSITKFGWFEIDTFGFGLLGAVLKALDFKYFVSLIEIWNLKMFFKTILLK
jgi:hypothetical protein